MILEYFHYSEYMTFYSTWKINYCIFNTKKILKICLENKKFCTNYCIGFFDIYVEWNLQQTLGYATSEISAAIVTHCKRTSFKGMHLYNSILPSRFYSGRVIILGFETYVPSWRTFGLIRTHTLNYSEMNYYSCSCLEEYSGLKIVVLWICSMILV